jgi:SAM-dependent methyltransferase
MTQNLDPATVAGFGYEWEKFDQAELSGSELADLFNRYFRIFPWDALPETAVGFDLGCGSGRWARCVAPRVGWLHCVDASGRALAVAKRHLTDVPNCSFHEASVERIPFEPESMDFGYSLGVLDHVPDTEAGIRMCVSALKRGAPFLVYLYYAFENRPRWYRLLWKMTDLLRKGISRLPHSLRYWSSQVIATLVYFPLAKTASLLEAMGVPVSAFPLAQYRHCSFYTMRTDALDRFGSRLERRFTSEEVRRMMTNSGLERIIISDGEPFWCALGFRA